MFSKLFTKNLSRFEDFLEELGDEELKKFQFSSQVSTQSENFKHVSSRTYVYLENGVTPSILSISGRNDGQIWMDTFDVSNEKTVTTKTSTTFFFLLLLRRIPRDSDHSRGLYLSPRVEIAALSTKRNKSDTIKNSNVGAK